MGEHKIFNNIDNKNYKYNLINIVIRRKIRQCINSAIIQKPIEIIQII